ncbi:MAG: thioredoxin family protein [Kiritimatiellales bacterium]|nr:thioredoxin family protein [Kiritimatiellales bacterium]
MRVQPFLLLLSPIVLAACTLPTVMDQDDSMMKDDTEMMNDDSMMKNDTEMMNDDAIVEDDDTMMAKAEYRAYQDGVIGNGTASVLFFHAAWCPICKTADSVLQSWYPSADLLHIYKVNYDTELELKKRFGIVQQHTFVRLDAQGNVEKIVTGPSDSALRSFLAL